MSTELSITLAAAADQGMPHIRTAAYRAGILWQCRCGADNAADQMTCPDCGSRADDACTPGSADPTPDLLEPGAECGHTHPDGVVCTRRSGHLGQQHVAGDGHTVVAA